MSLKWKTIITEHDPMPNNVFYFTISYNKTKADGTTKTVSYTVDIPDLFARMYCGNRKVSKVVKDMYNDNPTLFLTTGLPLVVQSTADNFKYKIAALIESNTLDFNPLWNVDGTVKVTEDRAKRQTDFTRGEEEDTYTTGERSSTTKYGNETPYTESIQYGSVDVTDKYGNDTTYTETLQHGQQVKTTNFGNNALYTESVQHGQKETTTAFGNNTAYTETIQYGQDETSHLHAAHDEIRTKETNPFNDSGSQYTTDKETDSLPAAYTDKDTRSLHTDTTTHNPHADKETIGQYTDTTTYNPHSDKETLDQYTDTTTYNPHADKHTTGQHTDTSTYNPHEDLVTSEEATDTTNLGERKDITEAYAYKDFITTERTGNIGVTKSTELLEDYRNLPTEFYAPILDMLMTYLSRGY